MSCQDSTFVASAILLARRHLPLAEQPVLHPDVRLLAASCGIPRAWLEMTCALKCFTSALVAKLLQAQAPVLRCLLAFGIIGVSFDSYSKLGLGPLSSRTADSP